MKRGAFGALLIIAALLGAWLIVPVRAPRDSGEARPGTGPGKRPVAAARPAGKTEAGEILEPAASSPAAPGLTLQVRLLTEDGSPVEGGKVFARTLIEKKARPGRDQPSPDTWTEGKETGGGLYRIDDPPPGPVEIVALAPGLAWATERALLPRPEPLEIRLFAGRRISGLVVDSGGLPVEGARASVRETGDLLPIEARTGADGRFVINVCPARDDSYFWLFFEKSGFSPVERAIAYLDDEVEVLLFRGAMIAGTVVEERNDRPMAGAAISFGTITYFGPGRSVEATSGPDGRFEVERVPPGHHRMLVGADGFPGAEVGVDVGEGDRIDDLVVRLSPGITLRIRVLETGDDTPIGGAGIRLVESREVEPSIKRGGETDVSGEFLASGLREGRYSLDAWSSEHVLDRREIQVATSGEGEVIRLARGGSIAGRVLDQQGTPLRRASVLLEVLGDLEGMNSWEVESKAKATTDAGGEFHLGGLPACSAYALFVSHAGLGTVRTQLSLMKGQRLEGIEVILPPFAIIRGWVLDEAGRGVPRASVTTIPSEENRRKWESGSSGESQVDGSFELLDVSPGTYDVSARIDGRCDAEVNGVEIGEGEAIEDLVLRFEAGGTLSGTVTDTSGRPVPGARVELTGGAISDTSGRFELRGLASGRYAIEAFAAGFASFSDPIRIPSGPISIQLERPARLNGRIVAAGATGLEGKIEASRLDGENARVDEATIDSSGRYSLAVPPGRYLIRAQVDGWTQGSAIEPVLREGERRSLDLTLERTGAVRGTVLDVATGEPVSEAIVWAGDSRSESRGDGSFDLNHVAPGNQLVGAWEKHFRVARVPVLVKSGETVESVIRLGSGTGVCGFVSLPGTGRFEGKVLARRADDLSREESLEADGTFEMPGLPPGEYEIVAEARLLGGGWFRKKVLFSSKEGEVDWLPIDLPSIDIAGRVLLAGSPVPDATVYAGHPHWALNDTAKAGPDGRFTLTLPARGAWRIEIDPSAGEPVFFDLDAPEDAPEITRDFDIAPR